MNYIQLIQVAVSAVKAIEQLMPDSPGKEKAEAALTMITEILGDISEQVPALLALFTYVVNILRQIGVFKVKPPVQ